MQYQNKKIDAALLGKIELARFLALSLRAFDRIVREVESSCEFSALSSWVTAGRLQDARLMRDAADVAGAAASPHALGEVRLENANPVFFYQLESSVREYRFDEEALADLKRRPDFPAERGVALHRLRLINTRNRLTHALIHAVLSAQAAYLRSGDVLALRPLSQASVSRRMCAEAGLPMVADAGRISRLVRKLSIALPNAKVVPLAEMLARPRQVHRHLLDHVLKEEKTWLAQGILCEPFTDEAIAGLLERRYGVRLLRRTVADIRRSLAIPDSRSRGRRIEYLAATEGFSALVPLTPQALRTAVPPRSGVYEIRAGAALPQTETGDCHARGAPHDVIYIGSAGDLRKRLWEHLRGSSDNALLHCHVAGGAARVRYRLVSESWRAVERDLYQVFCRTFGTPPPCNRMSP